MSDLVNKIRLGTRASRLALAQVAEIHLLIAEHFPRIAIEIVPITTSGDKILDKNLAEIGGKGLFIKELEEALIFNQIDIAVHSAKDVPPLLHEQTEILAFTNRFDHRDCFISNKYPSFNKLPKNAIIGTSSARRKAFILKQRPDINVINFRGNIDTRLNKIFDNEVDGAILAVSGLLRLGKENKIQHAFEVSQIVPAGGQGALALQVRKSDHHLANILQKINHLETQICVNTERSFLRELGASCATPVGAYAYIENNKLFFKTAIIDYDGSEIFEANFKCKASLDEGIKIGIKAGIETKQKAHKLLKKIIQN
ncbi:MAG: hydroxymethylbilane synthase [Alphaproteobacteria bacterium]|nr:hydroxymethylbilane synthase [Alphaproteobacteria bacterium]